MKVYVINDLHIKNTSDIKKNNFLNLELLINKINKMMKREDILIISGDIYDNENDTDWFLGRRIANIFSKIENTKYFIVGNHDIYMFSNGEIIHALDSMRRLKNSYIIETIEKIKIKDTTLHLVPYGFIPEEIQKEKNPNVLFGHFEVDGFKLNGISIKSKINSSMLKNYDYVVLAHFHNYQNIGNIYYSGANYPTRIDEDVSKKITVYDIESNTIEFIENTEYVKYFNLTVNDENKTQIFDEIKQAKYIPSIVRLSFESKTLENELREFTAKNNIEQDNNEIIFNYKQKSGAVESDESFDINKSTSIIEVIENNIEKIKIPDTINKNKIKRYLSKLILDLNVSNSEINTKKIFFKSIYMDNFGKYTVPTSIDLTEKTLIVGQNGVGKSTIINALLFCLYGKMPNKKKAINKFSKSNMAVKLEMVIDGNNIVIERFLKHKEFGDDVFITENGIKSKFQRTKTGAVERVEELIGLSYDNFVMSILLSSEDGMYFPLFKQTNRIDFFTKLINLDILNTVGEHVSNKMSYYEDKLNRIKASLESAESISSIDLSQFSVKKEERHKKELELIEIGLSKQDIKKADEFLEHVDSCQYEYLKQDFYNIKNEYESNIFYNKITNEEIDFIRKASNKLEKIESDGKALKFKLESNKNNYSNNREKIINTIKNYKININKIKREINKNLNYIKQLKENPDLCPTCGNILDEKHLNDEINKYNEIIKELKQEITSINIKSKIETLLKERKDIYILCIQSEQELNNKRDEYKIAHRESNFHVTRFKEQNIISLAKKIEQYVNLKNNYIKKEKTFNESINKLKSYFSDYEFKIKQFETYASILDSIDKIDEYLKLEKEIIFKNKDNKNKIKKIKSDYEKTKNTYDIYKLLNNMFSNKTNSFKRIILSQYLESFKTIFSKMFVQFFSHQYENIVVDIDDNLTMSVELNGESFEYDEFSNGQKTVIDLCGFFSMIELKKIYLNNINVAFIDEFLDKGVHKKTNYIIVNILRELNYNLFVITHEERYKEILTDYKIIEIK